MRKINAGHPINSNMQLNEVLQGRPTCVHPILTECCDFLKESQRVPVFKNLPSSYNDVHKVKVRQRKRKDEFTQTFNEAFAFENLRQRSVAVNSSVSFVAESQGREPFYIFPPNGYWYQYSLEVTNSADDYKEAFDAILELSKNTEIMEQLFRYSYTCSDLHEGLVHGSEIILYNIPHFYAVRAKNHESYSKLLKDLETWTL